MAFVTGSGGVPGSGSVGLGELDVMVQV